MHYKLDTDTEKCCLIISTVVTLLRSALPLQIERFSLTNFVSVLVRILRKTEISLKIINVQILTMELLYSVYSEVQTKSLDVTQIKFPIIGRSVNRRFLIAEFRVWTQDIPCDFMMHKVTPGQIFFKYFVVHLSTSFQLHSTVIFVLILLLEEGQAGGTREPLNKTMLVLSQTVKKFSTLLRNPRIHYRIYKKDMWRNIIWGILKLQTGNVV